MQQEKENIDRKYEQKRKAYKELEKTVQQTHSNYEREMAVQKEKYENLERGQKELINTLEQDNSRLNETIEDLEQRLENGMVGSKEETEHWKIKFYESDRIHADLQTEFEKEKALW